MLVVICVTRFFVHAKLVTVYLYTVVEISIVLFYFPSLPSSKHLYLYFNEKCIYIIFY